MGQLLSTKAKAGSFRQGSKWLTIEKSESGQTLRVESSASESLLAHGTAKLGLVCVFGRARTGKSFLMNKLADQRGLFVVRGGHESTTVGADLSSIASTSADADAAGANATMATGFVDVEGQGVEGESYDLVLVAPLLLVSKVVVFNWPGKLAKHEMLKTLGEVTTAAETIKVDRDATDHGGRGFGHLHIVMRDQADIAGVKDFLLKPEKARDEAATHRNKVRKILKECFASCRVWGLPPPVESAARLVSGDFTEADVTPAFEEKVGALKDAIMGQLITSHALCGRVLSAADAAELMPLLADATNKGQKEFVPLTFFEQMEQRQAEAAAKAAIAAFDEYKKALPGKMPMVPAALLTSIETEQQKGVALFDSRLSDVAQSTRERALARLTAHVNNAKDALVLANDKNISMLIYDAESTALQELEPLRAQFEKRNEPQEETKLVAAYKSAAGPIIVRFEKAIAALAETSDGKRAHKEVQKKTDAIREAVCRRNHDLIQQREQRAREEAERRAREQAAKEQREREERERQQRAREEEEKRERQQREAAEQRAREQRAREEAERRAREQAAKEQREREERERQQRAREQRAWEEQNRRAREQLEAEQREREARWERERQAREQLEAERWERARRAREEQERLQWDFNMEFRRLLLQQHQQQSALTSRPRHASSTPAPPPRARVPRPGFFQDANGRWRHPNGRFASLADVFGP